MIKPLIVALVLALAPIARSQSTAFTYQGQLKNGVSLAEGQHDFRFRLFDAASGGTQLGTTQCADNIQVRDGVFTMTIDFGGQFATPNPRFIEIDVRRDTGLNCTNTTGYTTLAPRQPITPAPTATQAASAFSLAAPDGSPAQAVFVSNNGNVGIGTTAPTNNLHIASTVPTLNLQDIDSAGTAGGQQVGYIDFRDSANTESAWVGFGLIGDPDFSIVNARPSGDIILNSFSGNVGIGTSTPVAKLDVRGNTVTSGSLGVGTTTPASKLDVRGNIQMGFSGELFAAGGQEILRIVRGTVDGNGQKLAGTGYTVTRTSRGNYHVTFSTPFVGRPTITASSIGLFVAGVDTESVDGFFVNVSQKEEGWDFKFNFIAVGPR